MKLKRTHFATAMHQALRKLSPLQNVFWLLKNCFVYVQQTRCSGMASNPWRHFCLLMLFDKENLSLHLGGPFTNYVTHFLLFFDHPPTYSNALVIHLLITYYIKVCDSNAIAYHPPTPVALRNL